MKKYRKGEKPRTTEMRSAIIASFAKLRASWKLAEADEDFTRRRPLRRDDRFHAPS
jgi:hypothetical protein